MMRDRAWMFWTVCLVLAAVAATGAAAGDAKQFTLAGQKDSPHATGTATIDGNRLTITTTDLKPNAVYTVWFVNMQPSMSKAGAGAPPYSFRTDAKGRATYTTELGASPVGQWQAIFIVRHPSGDPTDMAKMEDALMTKLM
jgi:hypothetical protein